MKNMLTKTKLFEIGAFILMCVMEYYTPNDPYTTNAIIPFAVIAAVAAPMVIGGISAAINGRKASDMETDVLNAQRDTDLLIADRQDIFDSSNSIRQMKNQLSNAYANLGVAVKGAEMQQQQTDVALSNMMEGMMVTGQTASATALAQAAAKSKQGISANIEQQEIANQKLVAKGEADLQQQKMQIEMQAITAEGQAWDRAEDREIYDIERSQAEADYLRNQQQGYTDAAADAFMAGVSGSSSVLSSMAGNANIKF
tara:strand:+ start:17610 stop:18377 length:768 start_codon:yes stop_codon:yes gene_type:complete